MAMTDVVQNPPLVTAGTQWIYTQKGLSLCGLQQSGGYGYFWDDLPRNSMAEWLSASVSTGSSNPVSGAGSKGALWSLASGATASSLRVEVGAASIVSNVSTDRWYSATRMKITTAVDAQAALGVGVNNAASNKTIAMGFFGGINATNFIVQYDGYRSTGSGLDLGVAVDTSFHVFEMWALGDGKIRGRIDAGAEVNATMSSAPADTVYPSRHVLNGTTAANREMYVDWHLAIFPR